MSFWVTFVGTTLTFFPMHIVGLLGMTRRVYTYEPGLGWDAYNLAETIGGFVLAAGLLLIAGEPRLERFLAASRAGRTRSTAARSSGRSRPRRRHYNFAVIPTVRSPYPNWDRTDSGYDLQRGGLVLDTGHETPATDVRDGRLDEILAMPSESPWPIVLAALHHSRLRHAARRPRADRGAVRRDGRR